MENVCHTLAGFALARSGRGPRTPLVTTAFVIGANLPDIDLAWSSFKSALVYYHYHRGWTHSIAGFFVLTLLWWLTLLAVDRWFLGGRTQARSRPGPLLLAAAIGIGSHLLMDAANSYGIRPFLPWSDRWVYGDLWVIVDPWLWLLLGGAVYVSGDGGRRRNLIWLAGASAAAIVVFSASVVPPSCRAAWAAGLAITIAICRGTARLRTAAPRAAIAGVALVLVYAALCAASHASALARIAGMGAAGPGGAPIQVAALPHPADPLRWKWIIADASSLRYGVVGALPGLDPSRAGSTALSRGLDGPVVDALMKSCAGEVLREFFRFPVAAVEKGADGGSEVVVRDARYTRQGRGFAVYAAPTNASGQPVIDGKECP
jgi:inner membrane protein